MANNDVAQTFLSDLGLCRRFTSYQMMSDTNALLKAYATNGSEDAFRELVNRYIGFVYSTALRRVGGDTHHAEDVTQIVFADLARHAGDISAKVMLGGWLHQRTFNVATTMMRGEHRRKVREQEAVEMKVLEDHSAANLAPIVPVLDEVIMELKPEDRAVILLRFFERRDLRSVGEALGTNEDAAQKRVSRALDKMRLLLGRKGVAISATTLGAMLAVEEITAAPAGLAATITAAVFSGTTTATTTTGIAATKAIAMTTLQKIIVAATFAVLGGAGIYEARLAAGRQTQLQSLRQQPQQSSAELDRLRTENQQLAKLKVDSDELARLHGERAELLRLRGEVGQLRRQSAERNQHEAANQSAGTGFPLAPTTEVEFQLAERQVSTAMFRVGSALRQFITNSPFGVLVDTNGQPNPDIFANFPGLPLNNLEIQAKDIQSLAKAVDEKSRAILAVSKPPIFFNGYYTRFYLLADGTVRSDFSYSSDQQNFKAIYPSDEELDAIRQRAKEDAENIPDNIITVRQTLESVIKSFLTANNGHAPTDLTQLAPYATTQEQQAALQTLLALRAQQNSDRP